MAGNKASKTISISRLYTQGERVAIADEIVEYIRNRSAKGRGPGNRKWTGQAGKYSAAYKNSLDFKIAGKSKTKVNQELSGELLTELDTLGTTAGTIEYGYSQGSDVHGKAEGNILGTYGKQQPIKGKARDFLKLTRDEMRTILKKFPLRGQGASVMREKSTLSRLRALDLVEDLLIGEDEER